MNPPGGILISLRLTLFFAYTGPNNKKNVQFHRLERDAKLGSLEERADALADGCEQFEKQAAALKSQFGMSPMMMAACAVMGLAVAGGAYWYFMVREPPAPAYPPPGAYPPPPPPAAPAPAAPATDDGGDADGSGE